MRLALFQPDIPQNLGSALRLCACLDVALDVIEPCGFPLSDRAIRRAAMDYGGQADVTRHDSWAAFLNRRDDWPQDTRIVLFTTKGAEPYQNFQFGPHDILLMGRESAGVPDDVHNAAEARLLIPMRPGMRSINVINAAAMALGEALRQTQGFAPTTPIA
ncbi:tRNA (cytidine(34)-2'-O)-methyltransferase [Asticcacaulis excentricus]|uniref:tRNA (cytidine(34)-2'-O)-methyltransferase n=1 Tax=Asticcacaulis excentricus (strain ATCC 15261 / DSM 4724 / KCTC 12464 / NCIMB 9791 / VKM B-1370 / CB 48) TaxID=573065 RepID=E8RMJ6_ASTEC|nr:tRNA (cytidine(34)-2'-O)-methyltransferase [Asticcacaulis excentricus]ADU12816.1 tRNA/rRNA methyltransferase (SpoU) [Asticcacaulis excentricus CB 48]